MTGVRAGVIAGVLLAALLAPAGARADSAPAPEVRVVVIVVQPGDTLWSIARRYGTTVEAIARANGLSDPHRIFVGQRLVIPVGTARSSPGAATSGVAWPLRGDILSGFGPRAGGRHDGVDIKGTPGAPVAAAQAGRVVRAGWYYDYGLTVIVDHGQEVQTLYGHLSAVLVRVGEVVRAGQPVGRVGCTGRCSGAHLHFEVRVQGRAVDPLPYLAGARAVAGAPAAPSGAPAGAASPARPERPSTTVTVTVAVDGNTVIRTTETFLGGRLVARREEAVTMWGSLRQRVVREYRVDGGVAVLVSESVTVEEEQRE